MKLYFFVLVLVNVALSDLISAPVDQSTCSSSETDGRAVFCCDGACIDGSSIGVPGQCQNWTDLCADAETTPQCGSDQVFLPGRPEYNWVDSGDGACYLPAIDDCNWQRNDWFWQCCACPENYTSTQGGVCEDGAPFQNPCVACSDPDEVLTSNFTCYKPQGITDCTIVSRPASSYPSADRSG
jgi:hypothetical protein